MLDEPVLRALRLEVVRRFAENAAVSRESARSPRGESAGVFRPVPDGGAAERELAERGLASLDARDAHLDLRRVAQNS